MSLATEIDTLNAQVRQIQQHRSRVEYARDAAQKDAADALGQLRSEFGVETLAEAEALAATLERDLVELVRTARKALEDVSGG